MNKKNDISGERITPDILNENSLEHLHRYAIATDFVCGKNALDIACGEGYGTALLGQYANNIVGIDISESTINKAQAKYIQKGVEFITGDICKIPFPQETFDVITCFETIEHIDNQEEALKEIKRVMKNDGLLLISTPNKRMYSDKSGYRNPFHKKELYLEEFKVLLKNKFEHIHIIEQAVSFSSIMKTTNEKGNIIYSGDYKSINKNIYTQPLYFVAIATNDKLPIIENSIFWGEKIVNQALNEHEKLIKSTITYRLGNLLLSPIRFIKHIFSK